jgi:hypothetical protein
MKTLMRSSRDSMFSQAVLWENDIFVLCVKKKTFGARIGIAWDIFIVFLHKT